MEDVELLRKKLDRERTARKQAEQLLEDKSRELYQALESLKKAQGQIIHSEKLATVGQLASGIAHELNTPIQFVSDNIRFLDESMKDLMSLIPLLNDLLSSAQDTAACREMIATLAKQIEEIDLEFLKEEIPQAVEQSLEGTGRVTHIVRAMKEFAHPGVEGKTVADINDAIESTILVAKNEWKYVAELNANLQPNLPKVPCFVNEFNQIILNIIINSVHAIQDTLDPEGGREKGAITISTSSNGKEALICITDDGTGMPPEVQKRVFDPFFTTKGVGKGTGQGLAIAHAIIVEKHQGRIEVDSGQGKGTTFTIYLPLEGSNVTAEPVRAWGRHNRKNKNR